MIDIHLIREKFEDVVKEEAGRGVDRADLEAIRDLDNQRRDLIAQTESLKQQRNQSSEEIAAKKKAGEDADALIQEMKTVGDQIDALDQQLKTIEAELKDRMDHIPNLPAEGVPVGPDEDYNEEIHRKGEQTHFDFTPKAHYELGENLDILDFEAGTKVSGARFVYYKGLGARLERALINFMLDEHQKEGYVEMLTPYLVNDKAMYGTGQYPKFTEDVYKIVNIDKRDLTLIPTSEVPLTNYFADEIIPGDELPIYVTAFSPCFRSEAGSAGRDTRGLIRLHQFHKVEMAKITKPEQSFEELEKMTQNGENILEKLGLPYRRIVLSTGDMGFSATKTYDLEVWMPAQDTYREISSCSNCIDFQARRAKIRYRDENGKPRLAHTLNGSGLAVGRCVAAIMENYQQADGSIKIPEILVPYMGGITEINPDNANGLG